MKGTLNRRETDGKQKKIKQKRKMMGTRLLLISGSWVNGTFCTNAAKSNTKRSCVCSHIDTVEKGQIVFLMSYTLWEALELNGTYHSYSLLNYCSQFIAAQVLSFHSWSHSICINVLWISNVCVLLCADSGTCDPGDKTVRISSEVCRWICGFLPDDGEEGLLESPKCAQLILRGAGTSTF